MLKAWVVKIGFILAAIAIVSRVEGPTGWIAAGAMLLLGVAVMLWAVFDVNSSFWTPTYWKGPPGSKQVALTFDDGPDPEYTARVLEILARSNVPAAFFVVGHRAEEHPELLTAIHQGGHILGNHSFSHEWSINFRWRKRLVDEIRRTNKVISRTIGVRPHFYRAPHGFKSPALGDALTETDMVAIGWQVRGFDAVNGDAARIAQRIVERVRDGGVILLHDGACLQGTADRSATLEALPVIIDGLRARGFTLVRLDELLGMDAYG
jgi:peptidoglycan-N-acetylglucosamine deacetylase